jgi:hypothetical protein
MTTPSPPATKWPLLYGWAAPAAEHVVAAEPLSPAIEMFEPGAEERWTRWVAQSAARDRQTHARVRRLATLGAGLALMALAIVLALAN